MRRILIVFTLLLLVGCTTLSPPELTATAAYQTPTDWATNTPVNITPTREAATWTPEPSPTGPHWSTDCLPDGVVPIHPNACPDNYQVLHWTDDTTQEIPELFGLDIALYPREITKVPNAEVVNGAMRLYVYYFAGKFEVSIPGLELDEGNCYTFNVPMALDFRGSSDPGNFRVSSNIYTDRGDMFPLNDHPVVEVVGNTGLETGTFPNRLHWEFMPSRNMTIEWSVVYEADWATAAPGNWVDFQAFFVQNQDNTTLCR